MSIVVTYIAHSYLRYDQWITWNNTQPNAHEKNIPWECAKSMYWAKIKSAIIIFLLTSLTKFSKTCLKQPLKKRQKLVLKTAYRLMQVKSIAECSKGSILQYFPPSWSYYLSLRSLFCLFLSSRFRQVYCIWPDHEMLLIPCVKSLYVSMLSYQGQLLTGNVVWQQRFCTFFLQ